MHVVVAIVGYRNPDDIVRCLAGLALSVHADFEVVICENGGPAAHADLVAVLPERLAGGQRVRANLAPANLGYAGGVNHCITQSPDADAWWVLNPDTDPAPEALAAKVARLGHGDRDAVGCILHLPNGVVQSYGGRWRAWMARGTSIGFGRDPTAAVDASRIEGEQNYLNGAAMLVSRRFVEVAGLMREDYFLYCEEVEWCLRAGALGLKLGFAEKAKVLHYQGTSTGNPPDIRQRGRVPVFLNERNKILLTRDRTPGLLPIVALTALGVIVMRFGRRGAWRQLGYALDGWRAGMAGERGVPGWLEG